MPIIRENQLQNPSVQEQRDIRLKTQLILGALLLAILLAGGVVFLIPKSPSEQETPTEKESVNRFESDEQCASYSYETDPETGSYVKTVGKIASDLNVTQPDPSGDDQKPSGSGDSIGMRDDSADQVKDAPPNSQIILCLAQSDSKSTKKRQSRLAQLMALLWKMSS